MSGYAILVQGTHGLDDAWWRNGLASAFRAYGWNSPDRLEPFIWDTKLDGIFGRHEAWEAAGRALKWYVESKCRVPKPLAVVAHSHGGAVALYAALYGIEIDHLMTVATPVRDDMEAVYAGARIAIKRWTHLYCDTDAWQKLGMLFDGRFGGNRQMSSADENIQISDVGHSGLLEAETWDKHKLWRLLQVQP